MLLATVICMFFFPFVTGRLPFPLFYWFRSLKLQTHCDHHYWWFRLLDATTQYTVVLILSVSGCWTAKLQCIIWHNINKTKTNANTDLCVHIYTHIHIQWASAQFLCIKFQSQVIGHLESRVEDICLRDWIRNWTVNFVFAKQKQTS